MTESDNGVHGAAETAEACSGGEDETLSAGLYVSLPSTVAALEYGAWVATLCCTAMGAGEPRQTDRSLPTSYSKQSRKHVTPQSQRKPFSSNSGQAPGYRENNPLGGQHWEWKGRAPGGAGRCFRQVSQTGTEGTEGREPWGAAEHSSGSECQHNLGNKGGKLGRRGCQRSF